MAKNIIGAVCTAVFQFLFCIVYAVWNIVMLITSPLWYPVIILSSPERAAEFINDYAYADMAPVGVYKAKIHNLCIYYLMRWLWTPLVSLLPMRYRSEFILAGRERKALSEYSVKTQVKYYKTCDDGGKQSLIVSNALSSEAFKLIWEDEFEWENWVDSGRALTKEQVDFLCRKGEGSLLWRYFKKNTPDKEMVNVLLKLVAGNYSAAQRVLLYFVRQQRPSAELIEKITATGNRAFIKDVCSIIDQYADLDAVNFRITEIPGGGDMPVEEQQSILIERWTNFCRHKEEISVAAQKKMGYDQYLIYVHTGHKLDSSALLHMCLHLQNEKFLREVLNNEFEKIDSTLQTALKSEYWRYSLYLKVKEVCSGKAQA
jgi:hypothetical protein